MRARSTEPQVTNAIILAAGRGSRMGAATRAQPKCLVELAGKPLLDWQKRALEAAGIGAVSAVGGYLADDLAENIPLAAVNTRWSETNMVRTLEHVDHVLEQTPTIVSYSDIVYHPDVVQTLRRTSGEIAIVYDRDWRRLWEARFADPLSDAETFRHSAGRLVEIGGSPTSVDEVAGQYIGLIKFTTSGWSTVRNLLNALPSDDVDRMDMTALFARLLAADVEIAVAPIEGRWCEVDSQSDRDLYAARLDYVDRNRRPWLHDWRF